MLVSTKSRPEPSAPYRIEHHPALGIVRVTASGLLSESDLEAYVASVRPALEANRRRYGIAKLLLDRRYAPVQPPLIHALLRELMPSYLHVDDALAYLVASALVSIQIKRVLVLARSEIFLEERDALAWLARF